MKSLFFLVSLVLSMSVASAADSQERALVDMVGKAYTYAHRSAFIFDLDETLVDSSPRRFAALKEAVLSVCGVLPMPRPEDCGALEMISLKDLYRMRNRYDIPAYLRAEGVMGEAMMNDILERSLNLYLSGSYIAEEDRMLPGALAFVRELRRWGAQVFFVSSRSAEKQSAATREFLMRRGLLEEGTTSFLYLKPDSEKSIDFKRRAVQEIGERVRSVGGRVDGVFENEPENVSAWSETFPSAKVFFVEGAYMHEGPIPLKAVLLRDFRY